MRKLLAVSLVAAVVVPAFAQKYHVSSRATGDNQVFMTDDTGVVSGQYTQIAGAAGDAWGYRDGAYDGTNVYFGWGGGVARHNADGTGGVLHIAGAAPGGVGTWRALAYDPTGDDGNGSLWTASFGTSLIEVSMDGTRLLTTFTNPTTAWSLYGLAYDDATGDLLGHHTAGEVIRIDISDPAGGVGSWVSEHPAGAWTLLSAQGGLSGISELGGDYAAIAQGTPDELGVYAAGSGGAFVTTGPPWPLDTNAPLPWDPTGTLGVAVTPEPSSLLLLGLGAAAFMRRRR